MERGDLNQAFMVYVACFWVFEYPKGLLKSFGFWEKTLFKVGTAQSGKQALNLITVLISLQKKTKNNKSGEKEGGN